MAVLALREYDRITCGQAFDPANRVIRPDQHRALEKFSEGYQKLHKVTVFQHGPRLSLVAQNFVGVINLGRDQVEVLPKIEGETSQVRHNLAEMISVVLDLELYDDDSTQVDKHSDSILEVLIRLFCQKLWQCVRKGIVRRYEFRSENLTVLRGRLSVANQIRHNMARPDRLACMFDEFDENNPLNHALKTALRILTKVAKTQANQRNIAELMFCFQEVDDIHPSAIDWEKAATNRLSARYKSVLTLARLFVEGKCPDIVSGSGDGFALLFDMNQLFENYVGAVSKRVFSREGLKVSLQGPKRHLARLASGTAVFQLKPDIVATDETGIAFIIDTKWKRLREQAYREGVTSTDVYQMYAYSTQYASPDVVLLYPHHRELGDWKPRRAQYWVNGVAGVMALNQRVCVSTIDMRDLKSLPRQLMSIFPAKREFNSVQASGSTGKFDLIQGG
jgi:5-methylcytosine-specific restriction enzyme subunit McrC